MTKLQLPEMAFESSLDSPAEATTSLQGSEPSLTLALVAGIGPVGWRELVEVHGSADSALASLGDAPDVIAARERVQRLRARCSTLGIDILTLDDPAYPAKLHTLHDPPMPLFVLGAQRPWDMPSVAIVGSRGASQDGRRAARRIARELAQAGVCVVSGMAAGIDTAAHEGALDANGVTVAVLGTGPDVVYPLSNRGLYRRILRTGAVASELVPGKRAHGGAFPRRNRIIAGLADLVLVVEAAARSGALITAQVADSIGRPVGACPGPIDRPECVGTNTLLRDGQHVILGAEDVLAILSLPRATPERPSARVQRSVATSAFRADTPEFRILEVLAAGPQFADDLVRVAGSAARDVGAALSMLTLTGLVEIDATGLVWRR